MYQNTWKSDDERAVALALGFRVIDGHILKLDMEKSGARPVVRAVTPASIQEQAMYDFLLRPARDWGSTHEEG